MTETTETPKPADVAGRLDGLVRRLYQHALPDPHDEREVLHAPLLLEAADAIERESIRADWFMQRCDALQQAQQHMRDPERKMVCDILANGRTFVTPAGRFSGSAWEKFAKKMFELSDWPEGGDIDVFDFQEAAVECGLLIPETRNAPCGENCFCSEYHGDMSEGVTCYRKAQFPVTPNV